MKNVKFRIEFPVSQFIGEAMNASHPPGPIRPASNSNATIAIASSSSPRPAIIWTEDFNLIPKPLLQSLSLHQPYR